MASTDFDDLLAANARYAETFDSGGLAAPARSGAAVVTCMDSRIDPLAMLGLGLGDAKVLRNPGGRVTDPVLEALVLGVHLLGVRRVLVVAHTRCAVASNSEEQLREAVAEAAGRDASWQRFHAVADQSTTLARDVARVRSHPLVPAETVVGGFVYDVDTGRLSQQV